MNDAVLLPEDRKCSRRNATPEKSTSGVGAFCGALMTHGLDDGLYGFCAWTSLRGVIQAMPQRSDVMRNAGRRVAELVRPSMFFGALIALDHVGEYLQRLGRNLDAAAFDTARGFSEQKTRAALI